MKSIRELFLDRFQNYVPPPHSFWLKRMKKLFNLHFYIYAPVLWNQTRERKRFADFQIFRPIQGKFPITIVRYNFSFHRVLYYTDNIRRVFKIGTRELPQNNILFVYNKKKEK